MSVALIAGLATIALVAVNLSMWRRMKLSTASRGDWSDAGFVASLTDSGCDGRAATVVVDVLRPYYPTCVAPQHGDDLNRFVGIDEEEVEDWTEQAFAALDLTPPTARVPELIPHLQTVGDWARYLNRRYRALSSSHA